jgi:hypothetical protein
VEEGVAVEEVGGIARIRPLTQGYLKIVPNQTFVLDVVGLTISYGSAKTLKEKAFLSEKRQ